MLKAPQPELTPQEQLIVLHQMGFTEEAIAHGLNVSQSTISRLIRGLTSPRYSTAKMIATLFQQYRAQ